MAESHLAIPAERLSMPDSLCAEKNEKALPSSAKIAIPQHERARPPIVYRYLTFETALQESIGANEADAAGMPDLRETASPFAWSASRKTLIMWLSCAVTITAAYSPGSYSPPAAQMSEYWKVDRPLVLVGTTTFTTGFALAPLFLAPFSELNGRRPVFLLSGLLYVISQLCCAVTRSFSGMLVSRFFVGVGGSTFSTMVGGVVSDIYHTEGH